MKVKILSEFEYQTFPVEEDDIEIEESLLKEIGKTKKFDVVNKRVVDYDNSILTKKEDIENRIIQLKELLAKTDYRAIKYAEGLYTEEEYAPYKEQRQAYRDEINRLESEL